MTNMTQSMKIELFLLFLLNPQMTFLSFWKHSKFLCASKIEI